MIIQSVILDCLIFYILEKMDGFQDIVFTALCKSLAQHKMLF